MVKMIDFKKILLVTLSILSIAGHARSGGVGGFMVYPTIMILNANKGEYTAKTNISFPKENGTAPIPIEIQVFDRTINETGLVTLSKVNTADFVAYPAQVVLMPGETKAVHIQWVGKNIPTKEKQYVVAAQQVPVKGLEQNNDPTKPMGAITAIVRYEAILIFTNDKFSSTITTKEFAEIEKEGKKLVRVLIENKGSASQKLQDLKFKVTQKNGDSKVIMPKIVNTEALRNGITAGGMREVLCEWGSDIPLTDLKSITPLFDIE